MIDIESLRGPDVVELCLIALFVIVVSIDGFVGMSFDDRRSSIRNYADHARRRELLRG